MLAAQPTADAFVSSPIRRTMNDKSKSAVDRLGGVAAGHAGPRRSMQWAGATTMTIGLAAALLPLAEAHGRTIGWLLLAAGLVELVAAAARRRGEAQLAMRVAGAVTMLAGLAFVADPLLRLYSLVSVVMTWLFARGAILLIGAAKARGAGRRWALFGAIADIALALVLLIGLPVTALVTHLFGTTPELVSRFALVLTVSFLISGFSMIALAGRAFEPEPNTI